MPHNIFIKLVEFHLKPSQFPAPPAGWLRAPFCQYLGTSVLFLATCIHRQSYMDGQAFG